MAEQDTELRVVEPAGESLLSEAASEEGSLNLTAAEGEVVESPAEPVSREEFDKLKTERDQLLDRLARLQAEFENARKRGERERVEFRDYATGSVVEQFLPVVDNGSTRRWVLWSGTTFPTSMWRKRFGQDTSCATAC